MVSYIRVWYPGDLYVDGVNKQVGRNMTEYGFVRLREDVKAELEEHKYENRHSSFSDAVDDLLTDAMEDST